MSITNIFLQKSLFQNKCVIVCITFDLLIKRFDLGSRLVVCVVESYFVWIEAFRVLQSLLVLVYRIRIRICFLFCCLVCGVDG